MGKHQKRAPSSFSHTHARAPGAKLVSSKLSDLQQSFKKKLEGARFRSINEALYTKPGGASFQEFQEDPALFDVYHQGFREMASKWPENPLHAIVRWIREKHKGAVVADMGCGDAEIARTLGSLNKVHSFDLVSKNPLVTAADIAHTPLANASVNIVIFCLSLMGTNIADFVTEAHRVLMTGGILKIAEVRSRFEGQTHETGGGGSSGSGKGIDTFVKILQAQGFDIRQRDSINSNKMFFMLEATKSARAPAAAASLPKGAGTFSAKACVYKKR